MIRIGLGVDVHPLVRGRPLILGGVRIEHDRGLDGHSDGDVLTHAVCDALLGAVAAGDMGHHFPSSDPSFHGISSLVLLDRVVQMVRQRGYALGNVDAVVLAKAPRLEPLIQAIRDSLAGVMGLERGAVSVKATSTDGLGLIGRGDGMAAQAVVVLRSQQPLRNPGSESSPPRPLP
ncbi:MAG: 2-C-methyl-D-erythritol 2,4-cyclodiphosphate synthase [Acidobacteriota bacterium]